MKPKYFRLVNIRTQKQSDIGLNSGSSMELRDLILQHVERTGTVKQYAQIMDESLPDIARLMGFTVESSDKPY